MTEAQQAEQDAAVERLRKWVKPGDTLYTIIRSVSRSGMSRSISVIRNDVGDCDLHDIDGFVARATGERFDRNRGGVKMQGAGMDMGFALIYNLGRVLFPDGFECVGDGCPSNDHSNGDRDYSPHRHSDGGYALRQRWL